MQPRDRQTPIRDYRPARPYRRAGSHSHLPSKIPDAQPRQGPVLV